MIASLVIDVHCVIDQASFLAYGPALKENYQTEPFQNIELYNLMACKFEHAHKVSCNRYSPLTQNVFLHYDVLLLVHLKDTCQTKQNI